MTDRHVLITGGAGYIGSLLTSELLRANYQRHRPRLSFLWRRSHCPVFHHPNFHFVKADVTEPRTIKDSLKDALAKAGFDRPSCGDRGVPCLSGGREAGGVAL